MPRGEPNLLNLTHVTICGLNRRDALGIARLAIDTLTGTVAGKPTRRHTLGERIQTRKALRDDVYIKLDVFRPRSIKIQFECELVVVSKKVVQSITQGSLLERV